MARNFPEYLTKVEFWQVHDLDCAIPQEAIPHLLGRERTAGSAGVTKGVTPIVILSPSYFHAAKASRSPILIACPMKIAYFDCASGVSGDMTLGALVDSGIALEHLQAAIDSLGFPNIHLAAEEVKRGGFRACKVSVRHEPEKAHRHLHHITEKIDASSVLTPPQKDLAKRIFTCIGEAEAKVHGTTMRQGSLSRSGRRRFDRRYRGERRGDLAAASRPDCLLGRAKPAAGSSPSITAA